MQVLKLGGSVITKKGVKQAADLDSINKLAKALGRVWKDGICDIVLVHGAGSFGHNLVLEHKIDNGVRTIGQKLAAAATCASCASLSSIIANSLIEEGVPAIPLSPALLITQQNKRIIKFEDKKVLSFLSLGYMPILRGDMVPDTILGMSVCSGDQIVARIGRKAERIIIGTNVDGVMADGKLVPLITSQNLSKFEQYLGPSSSPDVTGGMKGKIKELLETRVSAFIANAYYPERIEDLLRGKKSICTQIEF